MQRQCLFSLKISPPRSCVLSAAAAAEVAPLEGRASPAAVRAYLASRGDTPASFAGLVSTPPAQVLAGLLRAR